MSDITLVVSAPGPTVDLSVVAGTSVTVTVNEGGGGGVSTHAGLSDLATSGHPVSVITGALSAAAAAAAYQPLDADLTAIAALTSPATTITGAVPKSTVTTAGDLIYGTGNAAVSRLGIGSALQVLRTNAGATAPEWATVSSGAVSVIARTVLGSDTASVDFTGIPATYENLMVTYTCQATSSSTFSRLWVQFNGDTAANYSSSIGYQTTSLTVESSSGATKIVSGIIVDSSVTAGYASSGTIMVPGYARTVFNKTLVLNGQATYGAAAPMIVAGQGIWASTAAITQVTLSSALNNLKAGSVFTLYGIAGA